jgi:hypothetical protein
MCSWIIVRRHAIESFADDRAILHNHRAKRSAPMRHNTLKRKLNRAPHEVRVLRIVVMLV